MAYYEWGRLLKVEPGSLSIQPLGQLRSPEERRRLFGRPLWQRFMRRPNDEAPPFREPVHISVDSAQLDGLPRSLEAGEIVTMIFEPAGRLSNVNPGYDHRHDERCVAKLGSCRSAVLWAGSPQSSPGS